MVKIWRVTFGNRFDSRDVTGKDIHEAIDAATSSLMERLKGLKKVDMKVLEDNGELEIHEIKLLAESDN